MSTTAENLSLPQKSLLVSGDGPWNTHQIPQHGIEPVRLADGPHGLRFQEVGGDNFGIAASVPATCFPPAVAVGSSWSTSVAERIAAAIGHEARALGVDIVLGPGVNIKRSPLCGRNFEYFSEDPLLSGTLGTAYVRAIQAEGVGSAVKHFAVNNQETDRMRISADLDDRTLREIYFPAFEQVVKQAKPATVMCSYNKINGIFSSENRWLLTEVLRGEWGFEGAVMSDWGAVHDPAAAVRAGLDLEMPGTGGRTPPQVVEAVRQGTLDETDLNRSVDRILALKEWKDEARPDVDLEAHHRLAREVAAECAILLKNNGTLPLKPSASLAIIGDFARSPRFQGGGSSHVNAVRTESFLDALPAFTDAEVILAAGFSNDEDGDENKLREDAVRAASRADVTVIFAGLSEREESEGFDRKTIDLPTSQIVLIQEVAAAAGQVVVVLSNGGVVSVEGWHDHVDAILEGFLLGQAGGAAVADLLYGAANPSGRLAESVPMRLEDHPSSPTFPGEKGHVLYGERTLVGYRGFTTLQRPVRYPFGYGLSYTSFDMSDFGVVVTGAFTATVKVTITNTGDRAGAHVVQVYVAAGTLGDVQRPLRELRAFNKVFLEAGESRTIDLTLDRNAFAYWDVEHHDWSVAPGKYGIQLCSDSQTICAEESIHLDGDELVRELTLWSTLQEWTDHPAIGPTLLEEIDSDRLRLITQPQILRSIGTLPMGKIVGALGGEVPRARWDELMKRSAPKDDSEVSRLSGDS